MKTESNLPMRLVLKIAPLAIVLEVPAIDKTFEVALTPEQAKALASALYISAEHEERVTAQSTVPGDRPPTPKPVVVLPARPAEGGN